jgi:NAD(P)-dependent dehydrogenase (short-subunit alcohol dehydrogenase family)
VPKEHSGYQLYKAAGKLEGKKAIIAGGDSGIGRAIAILFAMEGADSMIVYLLQEESDALETQKEVEKWGKKCRLLAMDITSKENRQKVIDTALSEMGGINILVNNAAFQMVQKEIGELPDEQWHKTFNTNFHPIFYLTKMALPT